VALEVIPAIDVAEGSLARFTREGAVPIAAFGGDPTEAARAFAAAGATRIHVVDMDLAATGSPANLDVIRVAAGLGLLVQASGGVVTGAHVDAMISAGAERVVLGSAALAGREAIADILAGHADRLVVGIEADGPTIVPRGAAGRELPLWDTLVWLAELPVERFLYTEVGRAGALEGPDLDGIWALATHTGRPVIASGGIRGVEDLRAIAALGPSVEGAVVGRALYEGGLDLAAAIAAVG
jgi:phosphoribosylformimino-5-aminoimidazole carboxamide ribonucleotide (ProFAR) isomerase